MRLLRSQLDSEAIFRDSQTIAKTVVALPEYRNAGCIMAYAPTQNEVMANLITDIAERDGKKVCLPRIADKTMIEAVPKENHILLRNTFGIDEPSFEVKAIDPTMLDLVLVPGVAFDRSGNRIGFGKGYYDRFLRLLRPDCALIALAYDFQVLDAIPYDDRDTKLHMIVTEKEWIDCREN